MTDASPSHGCLPRAVIYTRKSNDPKQTFRSVEEQEAECRADAERQGWEVIRVFSDNDRSATRYARRERPAYAEMKNFLRQGGADVLLVWEGARAQRDLADFARLRDVCAVAGVLYRYNGRTYDMNRGDDRFNTGLDALLAERYAEETRQAVLRGMRANAKAGKVHGKLLYGYTRRYDERGELVEQTVREDQAAIVREAARRVARGETPHAVAMDLNARGVPAPGGRGWDLTAVRRMVINPAYAGHRVYLPEEERRRKPGTTRPIVSKAKWPAILDEKTWSRCVARMTDPARKTTRDVSMRWLLSNIATAAPCGAPLRVSRGGSEDAAHYVCSQNSCVSIRAIGLDTYVWLVMTERLSRPDAAKAYPRPADHDNAMAAAQAEAAEKRERLQGFYVLGARGGLTPAALAAIEAELLPEIEDAERRSREAVVSPALAEVIAETAAAPDPARVLSGLPIGVRRNLVMMLMEVHVKPAGKGARYRDPEVDDPELARIDPARVVIDWRK